ncbi:16S rRNA (guanine(966)-N(2))-methyltransferase RsmD [Marinilabiliaceae bacterium ANBcel2]|nr:16S rRNA (guanine(966)-N(2))-methyltransferase RsmD [Marinilabiliaceae bacterium ANBcel2]
MRIISGFLKGRRFNPPKNFKARPTTDTARESLFNILNNTIEYDQIKVLDLFSGTGAVTYEFVSRGVKEITSVEKNYNHYKFIKKTIEQLKIDNYVKTVKLDVFKFLKNESTEKFDLIFADPPFEMENFELLPDSIFLSNLLNPDALVIIEHGPDKDFSNNNNFKDRREYGKVNFSFFSL